MIHALQGSSQDSSRTGTRLSKLDESVGHSNDRGPWGDWGVATGEMGSSEGLPSSLYSNLVDTASKVYTKDGR